MKKIISFYNCEYYNHRSDFRTCPHCGEKQEYSIWEDQSVLLVVAEIGGKHGSVVYVSECPKCFEKSWVHVEIPFYDDDRFPKSWVKATQKEYKLRRERAKEQWENSLCKKCGLLGNHNLTTTSYVSFVGRMGPSTDICNKFVNK